MASIPIGSLRTANVVVPPSVSLVHERLCKALGASCEGSFGDPRATHVFSSNCPEREFGVNYFLNEFLSKFNDGKPSQAKEDLTWERYFKAEDLCLESNNRLRDWGSSSPYQPEILLARKIISKILGRFSIEEASTLFSWGPGSTTRLSRRKRDEAYKFCGKPQTTIGNAAYGMAAIIANPLWRSQFSATMPLHPDELLEVVPGNRIVTVPKSYKVDRTISIEPDLNIYVQKGVGAMIRRRLKRYGCDLDDQSRNQRLSLIGSVSGLLSTIDLSMASDTISQGVVHLLIRSDWLTHLEQMRSHFGTLPSGGLINYQKFSSMGNGFTFELESLIFYGLALAFAAVHGCEAHRISVYGDDIIFPSAETPAFLDFLSFLGFVPNVRKTFYQGQFRESCGKHYFNGCDVTPFYVKKQPSTILDLFLLHNQIWRYCSRADWLSFEQKENLQKICAWLRSYAPSKWRKPRLPDGVGDGAFIGTFDECCPSRAPHWIEGFLITSLIEQSVYDRRHDGYGMLVKALSHPRKRRFPDPCSCEAEYYHTGFLDHVLYPAKGTRVKEVKQLIPLGLFAGISPFW